jgi:CRP-like cAMP-binding protein
MGPVPITGNASVNKTGSNENYRQRIVGNENDWDPGFPASVLLRSERLDRRLAYSTPSTVRNCAIFRQQLKLGTWYPPRWSGCYGIVRERTHRAQAWYAEEIVCRSYWARTAERERALLPSRERAMFPPRPLRRNRLLAALANEDYAALVPSLEPVTLDPEATLIEAHGTIEHVYFPESGIASMIANTHEGRIEIGMIGREGLVGLPAVLGTDRTPFGYVVQGTGKAQRIATPALRAAIAERPAIGRLLSLYAVALSVQTAQTAYAHASFNMKARLARRILMTQDRVGGETLLLTHEFLSNMLGSRRQLPGCGGRVRAPHG